MATGTQVISIWKQEILKNTDDGARVITHLYGSKFGNQIKFKNGFTDHFKVRDENTASARARYRNGMWNTTDYGGSDQRGRNPFDLFAHERMMQNAPFKDILKVMAEELSIPLTHPNNL